MLRMVRKYRYMYRNFAIAHKCNLFLGFFGVTECVLTLKNLSLGTKNSPLSYPMARAKSFEFGHQSMGYQHTSSRFDVVT